MMQNKIILLSVDLLNLLIIRCLVLKSPKNVWDKLENIYAGDSNVKEEKLQIYREKFEQLRMKEDNNIAA